MTNACHQMFKIINLIMTMEVVKQFFETSTIHGLYYISTTRKWAKLFWVIIVLGGFSGAGYLIYQSFYNWDQSPISTTIETLPISQITYPKLTVCPPRNSYLNLNYDILHSDSFKLDNHTRNVLFEYALKTVQEAFYTEMMTNLSKVEDPNRYHGWYNGYTWLKYPYYHSERKQFIYDIHTSAISGNITTQYFGDKFNPIKVEASIGVAVSVYFSKKINNTKEWLHINLKTNSIDNTSDNYQMKFKNEIVKLEPDIKDYKNIIRGPFAKYAYIAFNRKISDDVLRKTIGQDMMPGFNFTWEFYTPKNNFHLFLKNKQNKQFSW